MFFRTATSCPLYALPLIHSSLFSFFYFYYSDTLFFFFFLIIRQPPRSTLFPPRPSSDLVFLEYRAPPDPKSLGPDGAPCSRGTIGLLMRRPVRAGSAVYIGKESNRHEEVDHGLVHAKIGRAHV